MIAKVVYKLKLDDKTEQMVSLPVGSKVLSVHEQLGITCIWYLCDPSNKLQMRWVYIFMTGQDLPKNIDELNFIGTIITADNFVLHIFEKLP